VVFFSWRKRRKRKKKKGGGKETVRPLNSALERFWLTTLYFCVLLLIGHFLSSNYNFQVPSNLMVISALFFERNFTLSGTNILTVA